MLNKKENNRFIIVYNFRELQYVLPLKYRHLFPKLFDKLDNHKEQLCITGYGLQDVSLEEVFLKVTEQYKTSPSAAAINTQYHEANSTSSISSDKPSTT